MMQRGLSKQNCKMGEIFFRKAKKGRFVCVFFIHEEGVSMS
jgi:hypothetical protein